MPDLGVFNVVKVILEMWVMVDNVINVRDRMSFMDVGVKLDIGAEWGC